jgi:hypothetical protein
MTKIEIIEETINFYSQDPSRRAVKTREDGSSYACLYVYKEKRCALSRCMSPEFLEKYGEIINDTGSITEDLSRYLSEELHINLDDTLLPKYRGHNEDFWSDIQAMHDIVENWDKNGLTDRGRKFVTNIKQTHTLN